MHTQPEHLRPTNAGQVQSLLHDLLQSGTYAIGDRLPSEKELQRRFGVSRTVVREGLAKLRAEGRVVARKGSGSFVARGPAPSALAAPPITGMEDLLNRHDLRVAIECETAHLAADRWNAATIAAIDQARLEVSAQLRRGVQTGKEDFLFHSAIAAATRNDLLLRTFQALVGQIEEWIAVSLNLRLLTPAQRIAIVDEEHAAIHDAIARRQPEDAARAMRRHLVHGRERILRGLCA